MKNSTHIGLSAKILATILVTVLAVPLLLPATALALHTPSTLSIQLELNPNENPLGRKPPLSYEIKATKSVEDVLTIKNFSPDRDYTVKVYAVDAVQSTDGAVAFKLNDRTRDTIGRWVTFNEDLVTVKANQTAYLPYRIDVPEQTPPGTFQGGLVVEIVNNDLPQQSNSATQIQIVPRLIESLIISVPGRKILKYNLDEFSYRTTDGKPCFRLKFSNQSNILLRGEAVLKVEGTMLDRPYELALNQLTVLQGDTLEKSMFFQNPPLLGSYKATLSFDVYEYNTATDQLVYLTTINKELYFMIIPWLSIFTLFFIIILVIVVERYRRRYLKARLMDTFTHLVRKGETILTIADLYQVNWKTIAKLNKLKSPYTIVPGDILRLPFPHEKKTVPSPKKRRQ